LFVRVDGTTKSSDFPSAFMSAVPSERFADRPCRLPSGAVQGTDGISRFSRLKFPHMHQVFDSAVSASHSPVAHEAMLPSPCLNKVGTRNETDFGVQYWACAYPLPMPHPRRYRRPRRVSGQRVWLRLHCKTLSFSTPSRFIPALSQTRDSGLKRDIGDASAAVGDVWVGPSCQCI
jgi:hypothetical protein